MRNKGIVLSLLVALVFNSNTNAQNNAVKNVTVINVDKGWAGNSINTVVFRKNSLTSFGDAQFISYYDADGFVVLGKRKLNETTWQLKKTKYKGRIADAHNSISIMLDGEGFLHMAWDHHNSSLKYCKSIQPLSLELTEIMPMTGDAEKKVSYPEFYKMPDGGILFFYRDGASGNGNLVLNKYDVKEKMWKRLQNNLIDGQGIRNAYWQACVDAKGAIHISWVWRESPDVASNHDMSYAISKDGGISWQRSTGENYQLPITISSAEKICSIPQNRELINQTSMCADENGNPFIASYWKGLYNVPQYQVIYKSGNKWNVKDLGFRRTNFSLSGKGTKQIPISRPQIICWGKNKKTNVVIVFRDAERNNYVSMASIKGLKNKKKCVVTDLYKQETGSWEPGFDTELWSNKKLLHLFVEKTMQADAEGVTSMAPQMIQVIETHF